MPDTRRRRRFAAIVAVLGVSALAITAVAAPAVAQSGDKRAQAAALQDQIEASDLEIGGWAEKLHEAQARASAAAQEIAKAETMIAAAREHVRAILALVRENAASLYRNHSSGTATDWFNTTDAADLSARDQYSEARAVREDELLDDLKAAQQDLRVRREEAEQAEKTAAEQARQIKAVKDHLEAARAAQQALLNKVQGEIADEIAAERARRAAAAQAQFSDDVPTPNVGPPNGSASQAIAYARAVIGSGYSTSPRTGPTYDCSGLTWSAWNAAGVSIPNTSGAQYSGLPKVPLAAAQPGDLIFWGPGGSQHVALYVGGGQIIDASSSQGKVVQRAIWGDPLPLAARVP